jgi:hypothetical protein
MKTMKKMMTLLAVAGLVLALAPAAHADATWTGLGDGFSWSDNDNWDVADITTAGGTFTLTGSGSTTVDVHTSSWTPLIGKVQGLGSSDTVNVGAGGTLRTTGEYKHGASTLNQTGGTVNLTNQKSGDQGVTLISGGSYFAQDWRNAYINSAGPQLQITGTNASSIQVNNFLTQLYSGKDLPEISYTLDAGGVTPLKVSVMGAAGNVDKLTINVDGLGNYAGTDPIPLFIDINSAINNTNVIVAGTIPDDSFLSFGISDGEINDTLFWNPPPPPAGTVIIIK